MPPFPERESSILAKLKKKRPDKVSTLLEPKASNSRSSVTDNNKSDQSAPSVSVPAAASVQNHVCCLVIISDIVIACPKIRDRAWSYTRHMICTNNHCCPVQQLPGKHDSSSPGK